MSANSKTIHLKNIYQDYTNSSQNKWNDIGGYWNGTFTCLMPAKTMEGASSTITYTWIPIEFKYPSRKQLKEAEKHHDRLSGQKISDAKILKEEFTITENNDGEISTLTAQSVFQIPRIDGKANLSPGANHFIVSSASGRFKGYTDAFVIYKDNRRLSRNLILTSSKKKRNLLFSKHNIIDRVPKWNNEWLNYEMPEE